MKTWTLAVASILVLGGCGGSTSDGEGAAAVDGGAGKGSGGASGSASGGRAGSSGSTASAGSTASGGSTAAGGRAGAGGSAGAAGVAGGSGTSGQCSQDSDCKLYDDCCTCSVLGPGDKPPPMCDMVCKQSACSARRITPGDVRCSPAGRCAFSFQCDARVVTCKSVRPNCDLGKVPRVIDQCWGECVDATACASVTNCAACTGPQQACVVWDNWMGSHRCVDVPTGCEDDRSCSCMGASACPAGWPCGDQSPPGELHCACPAC